MKGLYDVGGSLSFLIASTGVDPDAYYSVLDEEIDSKIYEKYLPHLTSSTISKMMMLQEDLKRIPQQTIQ